MTHRHVSVRLPHRPIVCPRPPEFYAAVRTFFLVHLTPGHACLKDPPLPESGGVEWRGGVNAVRRNPLPLLLKVFLIFQVILFVGMPPSQCTPTGYAHQSPPPTHRVPHWLGKKPAPDSDLAAGLTWAPPAGPAGWRVDDPECGTLLGEKKQ